MSWTEHADKYHHGPSLQRPGIDDIESRLAQVGYKPSDVDIVLFTHLHWDHIFYLEKFTKARFICNEVEWVMHTIQYRFTTNHTAVRSSQKR